MGVSVLCIIFDTLLVSTLKFSANLGVNGIGISNIIVNFILLVIVLSMLNREDISIFNKEKLDFKWLKLFIKQGSISGLESFVRNIAYMLMVCKMVNVVNEQGTYWMANNFIWCWILLPVIQLGELIKKDCGSDKKSIQKYSLGYFSITLIICALWILLIPLYKPFMTFVLNYNEASKLVNLVLLLLVPYIFYAIQNVFDATFYGLGKTQYMLFESIVTNSIYYGCAFILYKSGLWIPTLNGIALLFGFGLIFDAFVSFGAYIYLLKKNKINIFNVE